MVFQNPKPANLQTESHVLNTVPNTTTLGIANCPAINGTTHNQILNFNIQAL